MKKLLMIVLSLWVLPVFAGNTHAPTAVSTPSVTRTQFTTAVKDREPVNSVSTVASTAKSVTFFAELQVLAGDTIVQKWTNGSVTGLVVTTKVPSTSTKFRVWSTKNVAFWPAGVWTVTILDNGKTLASKNITFEAAKK